MGNVARTKGYVPPNDVCVVVLSISNAEYFAVEIEKITNILWARHYSISSGLAEDCMMEIEDDREDLDMTIQDGLYTFRPTADMLNDFEKFLLKVEDIAGRETGVVKVIVPKEL